MGHSTLLIDGNNLLVRSVRAMQATGLSADGVATGPLVSFINSLAKYVRSVNPDIVVVCWDGGRSRFRTEIFPEYKAGRAEQPSEAREFQDSAFALAKEFLALANIHQVQMQGYEADDLIARYWKMTILTPMVIVSGDKDLLQLVTDEVSVARPGQAEEYWDLARTTDGLGCTPGQWTNVLALAGDSSDGIPGVPRVGVKTAIKDLAKHRWLIHELILHGHPRYREYEDRIAMNLKLVDLRDLLLPGLRDLQEPPFFRPTAEGDILWEDLLAMLDRLKMASIGTQMRIGNFWQPRA